MDTQKSLKNDVRASVDALIQAGTTFDVAALDQIYHDDLKVISVDETGGVSIADKAAFKGLFDTKRKNGSDPLNTWAEFHHIEATDATAHVLVTRKVNLVDQDQLLTLSIDLIHQDDRWQVIREVIFVRPNSN